MKKIFLLLLLPLLSFSQLRDSVYVKTDIYEVMYSETLEQPLWVKYQVQCTGAGASRKGMDFYTDKEIHTSDAKDYAYNEWDKGHMAPAADFNCTREMLYKTFSYLNCSLQQERLNRVHWRLLEDYERSLAYSEGPVNVEIKIIFDKNPRRVPAGAAIPSAYLKTIKTSKKTLKFYFLNERPIKDTFADYQIK
ncbi:DNA/RNA endonuclease G [Flavobacterium phage vB_FspM_immuto_3-5A]|jgi:endonuclease G, mitochondrial|nr:DNA/RNA endonuclease G [Flavobacterium phage vB_FspM_immuto_3-5A]